MRAFVLGVATLLGAFGIAEAQDAAKVSYRQDRPGLETPRWSLAVSEDGQVAYHAELAAPKAAAGDDLPPLPAPAVDKTIRFTAPTTAKIFELARGADRFTIACESKIKNIAKTGEKTLSYSGPDGKGECIYNFSEVKQVADLTDLFQAAAQTLEMGRRLDFKRRFDRLGLDPEMINLSAMLEAHRAIEVGTIAPTLRAIANDTELLQRVRQRAAKMLQEAGLNGQ